MLTRTSSTVSKSKTLILLPLLLVSATCFSKNSFSSKFERNGKYVTYKGNRFELSEPKPDTMILTDPVTGEQITKIIKKDPVPVKMNGKPIPNEVDQQPYFTGNDKGLREYLVKNMKSELSKLDDGQYTLNLNNIVVDDKGKIVYFDYEDMKRSKTMEEVHDVKPANVERVPAGPEIKVNFTSGPSVKNGPMTLKRNTNPAYYSEISKDNQEEIFNKVCRLIDAAPAYKPATANGKRVVFTYYDVKFWNHFKVKDHKLYDIDKNLEYKEL